MGKNIRNLLNIRNIFSGGITLSVLYIHLETIYWLMIGVKGYSFKTAMIGILLIFGVGISLKTLLRNIKDLLIDISSEQ